MLLSSLYIYKPPLLGIYIYIFIFIAVNRHVLHVKYIIYYIYIYISMIVVFVTTWP